VVQQAQMADGTGASQAPFEYVCSFTAGTSFAWEKHLALRNTPYSSVKHSRVIRAGGDSSPHKSPTYEHDTPLGLSRITNDRDADLENTGLSMPYPTPKALFRDRPEGTCRRTRHPSLSNFPALVPPSLLPKYRSATESANMPSWVGFQVA